MMTVATMMMLVRTAVPRLHRPKLLQLMRSSQQPQNDLSVFRVS
jgi:hypothetical protein